ncbi:hypothetical protein HanPSC8_Chr07g0270831 [Helianthus annuus]|nr:hypothetical protein HanPSC8_Chr07g0270831 [Helianthus annuus]
MYFHLEDIKFIFVLRAKIPSDVDVESHSEVDIELCRLINSSSNNSYKTAHHQSL